MSARALAGFVDVRTDRQKSAHIDAAHGEPRNDRYGSGTKMDSRGSGPTSRVW
jgi:hypothetical protein